jgi:nitrate reductase / nitrite oxidoreductase, beta subunit
VCSETCVGRLRYIGLVLYDADRVLEAASTPDEHDLYEAQRSVFLDPNDPKVIAAAEQAGIPRDWVEAAQRSPIYALINTFKVALPLHPEYRTMPMVWYIPPLSPVVDVLRDSGHDGEDVSNLFGAVEALRIPVEYLAGLFTAGDPEPVTAVLRRLGAMRAYQRRINLGEARDESIATAVGMTGAQIQDMYRLLAIAKYDERYVIPPAHRESAATLEELAGCSLDSDGGPGMGGDPAPDGAGESGSHRPFNLLTWNGKGRPAGMFPPARPNGHGPDGHQSNGHQSNGHQSNGHQPDGQRLDGERADDPR